MPDRLFSTTEFSSIIRPIVDTGGDLKAPLEAAFAAAAARGLTVRLEAGRTYTMTAPANFSGGSVRLDMAGATVVAPAGFLTSSWTKATYTGGALFSVAKGATSFSKQAGHAVAAGDVLRFESDTVRVATGNYLHGQYARVLAVSGNTVTVNVPFYDTYQVDRFFVLQPLQHTVRNGTIDISGAAVVATGNPVVGMYLRGDRILVDNITVKGGAEAGMGLQLEGVDIIARDCKASDVVCASGIPAGGRTGYGIAADGDTVSIIRPLLERCKHAFSSASRTFTTRVCRVVDAVCTTPSGAHGETVTTQDSVTSPRYQSQIDVHGNCLNLDVIRPIFDGVNSAISVRNGRASILDPVIRTHGVTTLFRQDMLICAYEAPIDRLYVRNARVITEADFPTTGAAYPTLAGIQTIGAAAHGSVIIDGAVFEGAVPGRAFWMPYSGNAANDAGSSLSRLEVRGLRGAIMAGIQINAAATGSFGAVGDVFLDADAVLTPGTYGNALGFLDIRYAASVGKVTVRGRLDGAAGQVEGLGLIHFGASTTDPQKPPTLLDCRDAVILAKSAAAKIFSSATDAVGPGWFQGAYITHGAAGAGDCPGVYVNVPTAPNSPWLFAGATILTGQPSLANMNNIRFVNAVNYDPSGALLNHNLPIHPRNFGRAPIGMRHATQGTLITIRETNSPAIMVDHTGVLYAVSKPSASDTVFRQGTVVLNASLVTGGVSGWIRTATAWVPLESGPAEIISVSADLTFDLSHAQQTLLHPAADTTARTWTIPANASVAMPVGTTIALRNQSGAGVLTIAITTDTLRMVGAGTTGSRTLAAGGEAVIMKETATEWSIRGTGIS